MSVSDYVIDVLLIAVIFRQVRPRELTLRSALLPLVLMVAAGVIYLRTSPLGGNDVTLIVILTAAGVLLGVLSGSADRLWRDERGRLLAGRGCSRCWPGWSVWASGSVSWITPTIPGRRRWPTFRGITTSPALISGLLRSCSWPSARSWPGWGSCKTDGAGRTPDEAHATRWSRVEAERGKYLLTEPRSPDAEKQSFLRRIVRSGERRDHRP